MSTGLPKWGESALVIAASALALLWFARATRASEVQSASIECLAHTGWHEARGEGAQGARAVMAVAINRTRDTRGLWPSTICAVVWQGGERPRFGCQFIWWCDGRRDAMGQGPAQDAMRGLARGVLADGSDPSLGATCYHGAQVRPLWAQGLRVTTRIGNHVFLEC